MVSVWDSAPCCHARHPSSVAISIFVFIPLSPVWLRFVFLLNMNCKISGRVRPFLAVAPCAAFDNERKFRASKQSLVKKTYPRGLVENEDGRVHFWDSRVGGILQLVTLAGRFNHHGAVLDFNAADVNPAPGGGEVLFVAHAKGVIIDNDQPAFRRSGNALRRAMTCHRSEEHTSELQSL